MRIRPSLLSLITLSLLAAAANAEESSEDASAPVDESAIRVVSFSIIDTKTQKPVEGFAKITKNDTIAISKLPSAKINVRANVSGKPGSVRFIVPEKKIDRVESKAPYSLAGDLYGRFLWWTATPGTYTLAAVPYELPAGRGDRGEHLVLKVKFTE